MTIIYSLVVIDSLSGAYIDPFRFDGVVKGAKLVYADDVAIKKAYEDAGIEVKAISKKSTK